MEGPTYFIVFGDANEVPPPFRIDNLAEVCTVDVVTEIFSTLKFIQHSNIDTLAIYGTKYVTEVKSCPLK